MFSFSTKTQVNKQLKLKDVLHEIRADRDTRKEAQIITSLVLTNVINSNTINCDPNDKYKEIYIFMITVNKREMPKLFITGLDNSIRFHTFFIVKYEEEIAQAMAFKTVGQKVTTAKYTYKDFKIDTTVEIPSFHNVPEVYKYLLSYTNDIPRRREETPEQFIERINLVHRFQFQIMKTEPAVIHEVQPKKKYIYNTRLNEYRKELKELMKGDE